MDKQCKNLIFDGENKYFEELNVSLQEFYYEEKRGEQRRIRIQSIQHLPETAFFKISVFRNHSRKI